MRRGVRLAAGVYALLQRLLPKRLRAQSGPAMREVFEARLAAAPTRRAWLSSLLHELGGLVCVAVATRLTATRSVQPRERKVTRMDRVMQDVRSAVRGMRRNPSLLVLTVLTLGLGIGATTAMYSVIYGVLLRPLPFDRPEQIMLVYPTIEDWRNTPGLSASADRGRFNYPELQAWKAQQRAFIAAGGMTEGDARVPLGIGAERVSVAHIDAAVWTVLGAPAQYGRLFTEDEDDPSGVVVLSHGYWRTRFGSDPAVVGGDIQINDRPVRVIGVLPRSFDLPGVQAELWQPLVVEPGNRGAGNHSMRGIGRLRDGVSRDQAEAEVAAVLRRVNESSPSHLTHEARLVNPVAEASGGYRTPLLVLLAAAAVLLAAACASTALLLLGAGADRLRELAIRGALGADQTRLALQLFLESLVLAAGAAAAGLLIASGLVRVLVHIAPARLPRADHIGIDWMTFAFAAGVGAASALLIGAFPALSLSRVKAAAALRVGVMTPTRGRLQRGVVVVQLALATMLLLGAGLLTRTMHELQRVDPGFAADDLLTVQVVLPYDRMRDADGGWTQIATRVHAYSAGISAGIAGLPGVGDVALIDMLPFGGGLFTSFVEPEGHMPVGDELVSAGMRHVSANYMAVMGIPVVQGRGFTADDERVGAAPVVLVNERFARQFWRDGRWAGRRIGINGVDHHVAGVVSDMYEQDVRGDSDMLKVFMPGRAGSLGSAYVIRTSIPPEQLITAVRERIAAEDAALIIGSIMPMRERISGSLAEYRYRMRLMIAFSVIAAAFALLGVYGVMSRAVASRRQELGVRIALGAQKSRILALVLQDGLRVGAVGAAAGIIAGLLATRSLESMIWGVHRTDAVTIVLVAVALLALGLVATLVPAIRAARVEPARTLRG